MAGEHLGNSKSATTFTIERALRIRQNLALPLYAVALMLSYVSDAIAKLAAVIARDP
jgi:hypothetical protein